MLFNLFLDTALRDMQPGLMALGVHFLYKADGVLREMPSRNILDIFWATIFADDMALVTPSESAMQQALQLADDTFSKWGLEMSLKKTKVMVVGSEQTPAAFHLARGHIETVPSFKYLGSYLTNDGSVRLEISQRIKAAGYAFHKLQSLWKDKHVKEAIKVKVYQTVVQATLLYACETWAASLEMVSALEVFQMHCIRRMLRISRREHVPNAQMLARTGVQAVHALIRFRRLRWLGHVARQDNSRLPKRMLYSRLDKKASKGRPLKCWTDYVREDLEGLGLIASWARKAQDRDSWRTRIQQLLGHTQQHAGNV